MKTKIGFIALGLLLIVLSITGLSPNCRCCRDLIENKLTISKVTYGDFEETIPANGKMIDHKKVMIEIDEMYFGRIIVGSSATCLFGDTTINLMATEIGSLLPSGRFNSIFTFSEPVEKLPPINSSIRSRISLSGKHSSVLLPGGGFYKDTAGRWVIVVDKEQLKKRYVSLGRHDPNFFEVLSGLSPGEEVITSSYQNYLNYDFNNPVSIDDLE